MNFQTLELDTRLFQVGVAKILPPRLSVAALQKILAELKQQSIRLVYWPSDSNDATSQQAAKISGGVLCCEQVTYLTDLNSINVTSLLTDGIEIYQEKTSNTNLEELAFNIGATTHFKKDPKFPHDWFIKMYRAWVANSVNGSVATRVIVSRNDNKIVGMATLGTKNNRGDIGLLAVNKNFRGKKLGQKLVQAALVYFMEQSFAQAQVVTQKANVPACKLYEKCGFRPEKTENYYHFWL